MEENDKNQETKPQGENPAKVEIEIVKFKRLIQALENPKLLWKLLLSFGAMIVLLFFGLSMVAVIIKSMFPYETIKTNPYGATIMEDEEKEVVYWLFNSSELWANSGIMVNKGDVLTIRSSGKMHTAIHHLVDAAENNSKLAESWSDTDGDLPVDKEDRNSERLAFRIAKNAPQNKLLMKVVDNVNSDKPEKSGEHYVIGKERTNIIMTEDGYLHFAVNDIEMTDIVISGMYKNFMDAIVKKGSLGSKAQKEWEEFYNEFVKTDCKKSNSRAYADSLLAESINYIEKHCDTLSKELAEIHKKDSNLFRNCGVGLGHYYGHEDSYPILNEVLYYKHSDFKDAWFADNVGSFLIVIEITKNN